jgi:hypothetical protein
VRPYFKALVLQRPSDLREFLDRIEEIQEPIIVQPFRDLPDLKVLGVRSESGEILAMRPYLAERKFKTVTLTLMRAEFPPGVEESCRKIADLADLTGGFAFDLLYDPAEHRACYWRST